MRNGTMCLFLQAFRGSRTMGKKTWFPRFHGSTVLLGDRGTVDRGLRIEDREAAFCLTPSRGQDHAETRVRYPMTASLNKPELAGGVL